MDLIRWQDNDFGGYLGFAGTLPDWFCQIWKPDRDGDEWVLQRSAMAGRTDRVRYGSGADELKARAEELLREFAASIGAVFPDEERWQALRDFIAAENAADEEFRQPFHESAGLWRQADAAISARQSVLLQMSELES